MKILSTLKNESRGASLVEYVLLLALLALVAVVALPMMGVGVNKGMCAAINGIDGEQFTWWEEGNCYTQDSSGGEEVDILF